jgi:hypothetical protein
VTTKGDATTPAELGDPVATDRYALCVFATSTTTPTLLLTAQPLTYGGWSRKPGGFSYRSTSLGPDGLKAIALTAGVSSKAKVTVQVQGDLLPLPSSAGPLALPLLVQLQRLAGRLLGSVIQRRDQERRRALPGHVRSRPKQTGRAAAQPATPPTAADRG